MVDSIKDIGGVVGRSLKQTKSTDARTYDLLKLYIHTIVIRLANDCIGIYQLLTATIFIVHNSLLPFNLEENGFMNEYYKHPRV